MSSGLDTQPTATTIDVEQLVRWAWDGRIRIPSFQRPLRWRRDDVIKLFDSIVRGYPVGSLLLWRRSAAAGELQLGALRVTASVMTDALWVVDGQQRIISLANALSSDAQEDERFNISYDLRKKKFVPTPPDSEATIIPLSVIFDLRGVLRWFADRPEAIDYVDAANEVTRTIRQFKIPAYEVAQEEPEVLRDIFDRMNNYGKRLTRAEIFSALFAEKDDSEAAVSALDRIAQDINDDLRFGLIDNDTILLAVLARRAPDVHREIRNEFGDAVPTFIEFREEDRETAYSQGGLALRDAVEFLQKTAGVPHVALLPYKYPLTVLSRFFSHFAIPDERSLQLLRRWFWRTILVGPGIFGGGTSGAVRALNRAVQPGDLEGSIRRLLELIPQSAGQVPNLRRFRSNEAATKLVLCSWWYLRPQSLRTGEPFEIADISECIEDAHTALDAVQYVISRYGVPREQRPWSANRALYPMVNDTELDIRAGILSVPIDPLLSAPEWERVLNSHSISLEMVRLIEGGHTADFLIARQAALENLLDTFIRQRCEWDFEDTPPLDSLVLDDEDEAEDLSDDDSAGLR